MKKNIYIFLLWTVGTSFAEILKTWIIFKKNLKTHIIFQITKETRQKGLQSNRSSPILAIL